MTNKQTEEVIKECLHPRGMLITSQKGNIRCCKCKKLWVSETAIQEAEERGRNKGLTDFFQAVDARYKDFEITKGMADILKKIKSK